MTRRRAPFDRDSFDQFWDRCNMQFTPTFLLGKPGNFTTSQFVQNPFEWLLDSPGRARLCRLWMFPRLQWQLLAPALLLFFCSEGLRHLAAFSRTSGETLGAACPAAFAASCSCYGGFSAKRIERVMCQNTQKTIQKCILLYLGIFHQIELRSF